MNLGKMAGLVGADMFGKNLLVAAALAFVLGASGAAHAAGFSDNFDDVNIDTNLWVTHGYLNCFQGGGWDYSFAEQAATDGYLKARVWGPTQGISYGAEARVRTKINFNNGGEWLVNFTWDATAHANPHVDVFGIQITDGSAPDNVNWAWPFNQMPAGTKNLWLTGDWADQNLVDTPHASFDKRTWSVLIHPQGTACLYQSPDASGTPFREVSLDKSKDWYLQFLVIDATSSGFTAGDCSFKLYDFSATPEPVTLSLLALGGLAVLRRRKR